MAWNTQVFALAQEQPFIGRLMAGMASQAFSLLNRRMYYHVFFLNSRFHIFMAEKAKASGRTFQIMDELTSMRIVTGYALLFIQGFMHNL